MDLLETIDCAPGSRKRGTAVRSIEDVLVRREPLGMRRSCLLFASRLMIRALAPRFAQEPQIMDLFCRWSTGFSVQLLTAQGYDGSANR